MDNKIAAVKMRDITKRFGSVVANDRVWLDIYRGEILALLGENGSGKTTLMNMLSGIYFPDEGQILIDGEEVVIRSPRDAYHYGIGMIHQHFKLVDVFTAAENITLGLDEKLDLKATAARIRSICERYGFDLDPNQKIVIAFNPERVRDIAVVSTEGVGRAEVKGHLVELADVTRGGSVCINLSSRALDRVDGSTWRLHAGPLMRRYLDGYLPMQARLAFRWPEGLLRLKTTQPGEQPGVQIDARASGADLDLVFAGRMRATVDLARGQP